MNSVDDTNPALPILPVVILIIYHLYSDFAILYHTYGPNPKPEQEIRELNHQCHGTEQNL